MEEFKRVIGTIVHWFASDKDGCIAHFCSNGMGCTPRSHLTETIESQREWDYFMNYTKLKSTPIYSESLKSIENMSIEKGLDFYSQINWAKYNFERYDCYFGRIGLFSYLVMDEEHVFPPYVKCVSPSELLMLADLPVDIQVSLEKVRFSDIRFLETEMVTTEKITSM